MAANTGLTAAEVNVLRELGAWQAAEAANPRNQEKIRAWLAHDAGTPDRRVMVQAEIDYLQGTRVAVGPEALRCTDPWARQVERGFRLRRYSVEQVQDDRVVPAYAEYGPQIGSTDFGVPSGIHREAGADGLAFNYRAPLANLDAADFARLRHRSFSWDREGEARTHERLDAVFAGILPVRRRDSPWQFHLPITSVVLDLVGLDRFMTLMYDNPAGLHRLMAFLRDDHLAYLDWLEAANVLELNNESDYVGAGSMGYTRDLPAPGFTGKVRHRDRWGGSESQESVSISPAQYREFVFPYLLAIMARFGKVYYGCCEPVDPILDCLAEVPNLARVSVSAWANEEKVAAFCRCRGVAYSRKPSPNFLSGVQFDEAALRAHLAKTVACAHGCRLEFIQRDVYTTHDQPERFNRWCTLVREAAAAFHA